MTWLLYGATALNLLAAAAGMVAARRTRALNRDLVAMLDRARRMVGEQDHDGPVGG